MTLSHTLRYKRTSMRRIAPLAVVSHLCIALIAQAPPKPSIRVEVDAIAYKPR